MTKSFTTSATRRSWSTSELVGIRWISSVPIASNARNVVGQCVLVARPAGGGRNRVDELRRNPVHVAPQVLDAPERAARRRSPMANQNDVARCGAGLPPAAHAVARDVEQLVLLVDVEVHRDAGQAVGPRRRAAHGFRADSADQQLRTARADRRRTDREHRFGDLLARPHPFHDLDAFGHLAHGLRLGVRADGEVVLVPAADADARRSGGRRRACRRWPAPWRTSPGHAAAARSPSSPAGPGRSRPPSPPAASGCRGCRTRSAHPSTATRTGRRRQSGPSSSASPHPGPVPSPASSSQSARSAILARCVAVVSRMGRWHDVRHADQHVLHRARPADGHRYR